MTAVVAVGARTPLGLDARQTGFLLRAGFPTVAESPLANEAGEPITMATVPTLDPRLVGAERLVALARPAFAEAVAMVSGADVEVYVALDEGLPDAPAACAAIEEMVRQVLPSATSITVEPRGEGALGGRLPDVMKRLETRRLDVAVLGGVHSDWDPRIIADLESGGRLFTPENLDSRMPGECAAFFVLMRPGDAKRFGLAPHAKVLGVGSGIEQARPDNDHSAYEALGMTAAMRGATEELARRGGKAGWMFTDLTFESRRQYEWQSVFVRSQPLLSEPYIIESPGQRMGYMGAAALPLFVAVAATAWEHGYAPSPIALALAGADGGERAALVITEA